MIKLFIKEDGSAAVQQLLRVAGTVVAAEITYVEGHSALARMRAGRRLSASGYRAKRTDLTEFWEGVAVVEVSTQVVRHAADLAARHVLRAYDAVQLSSALVVRDAEETRFACWDDELRHAARNEGLTLAPT